MRTIITLTLFVIGSTSFGTDVTVHKQSRRTGAVTTTPEAWHGKQSAIIVCDMWDAHHCLNAVRRAQELAPRMNQVLQRGRELGMLIVHAPSSCMEPYKDHPGRKLAQDAPKASNLPADIGQWCKWLPQEEQARYPIDQTDGGEDDDPQEHLAWSQRLAGMGRDPKRPWRQQIESLAITAGDAISDSGVEIWNLLEQRGIRNVILLGVHTNMCVLGRPFGLRQLAKNGKNVVLMRDMTDTMYNPQRAPFVTHFVGTDRIVEHIETHVCPSITSVDLLGGQPFRFANDRRRIVMMIGEDEYETAATLPAFVDSDLKPAGFEVTLIHDDPKEKNRFPGLTEALPTADLLFVSVRRRSPAVAEVAVLREHARQGKPIVGIRTASHAYALRAQAQPASGFAVWPEFDAETLGGHYTGHHANNAFPTLSIAPGQPHPILNQLDWSSIKPGGSLYKTAPLAITTTPVLLGAIDDKPTEPVAWTNQTATGSRVFYTSLGHKTEFSQPAFRRLLVHGLCWTLGLAPPGLPPVTTTVGN